MSTHARRIPGQLTALTQRRPKTTTTYFTVRSTYTLSTYRAPDPVVTCTTTGENLLSPVTHTEC